jgi:formylglycine-generating enzyme required for sulfatase activity
MTEIGVPQELYEEITGMNPSFFVPSMNTMLAHWPVDSVNWYDAVEFCIKLTETKPGLTQVYTMSGRTPSTGYPITNATVTVDWNATGYRLPTDAEWEYACRAGTTTAYNTGSNYITIDDANFDDGSDDAWWQTIPGGRDDDPNYPDWPWIIYPPNDWGLYDMHGNVEEWCWDWFSMYSAGAVTDPKGPTAPVPSIGNYKIARGGAFLDEADDVRSACRPGYTPGVKYSNPNLPDAIYGPPWMSFRVVLPYSDEILNWNTKEVGGRSSKAQMQMSLQAYSKAQMQMKAQMKAQTKMQKSKALLQSIKIQEKKLNVSPVRPQALRRKSVFE